MLDEEDFTVNALCSEPCKIYSFRAEKIKRLFEKDHSLGYIMSHEGVWQTTADEIAEYYIANYYDEAVARAQRFNRQAPS